MNKTAGIIVGTVTPKTIHVVESGNTGKTEYRHVTLCGTVAHKLDTAYNFEYTVNNIQKVWNNTDTTPCVQCFQTDNQNVKFLTKFLTKKEKHNV